MGIGVRVMWWWRLMGIRIAILALLVAMVGCNNVLPSIGDDYPHMERAVAEIALASAGEAAPDNDPDDKPSLGKCRQCNGTGKVGDGTVFTSCVPCGGDGRIDERDVRRTLGAHPLQSMIDAMIEPPLGAEEPEAEVEAEEIEAAPPAGEDQAESPRPVPANPEVGELTLHITDITKRGWPSQWYRDQAEAFRDRGWTVRAEKHDIADKQSAYIDVCTGGQCWQFYGPIEPKHVRHLEITQ